MASQLYNALIKCYQIIHFWKLEFNDYLIGLIFIEKGLNVHVQPMLKMSRVHTLAENLSKIYIKKNEGKLGTLFTIMV